MLGAQGGFLIEIFLKKYNKFFEDILVELLMKIGS